MKNLVFDTSALISIASNNLLWTLPELKKKFEGEFWIVDSVKQEMIDVPIHGKKYKLEAIMTSELINRGILKLHGSGDFFDKVREVDLIANSIFRAKGQNLQILHSGEIASIALACQTKGTLVIDERTTRLLMENAELLARILRKKLHTQVYMDKAKLKEFNQKVCNIDIIRSVELMTIAYELGMFDRYLATGYFGTTRKELLDGLLWALKLRGCSITGDEINEIIGIEKA